MSQRYLRCRYCEYLEYDDEPNSHYCDCIGGPEEITPDSPACPDYKPDGWKIIRDIEINEIIKAKAYLTEPVDGEEARP